MSPNRTTTFARWAVWAFSASCMACLQGQVGTTAEDPASTPNNPAPVPTPGPQPAPNPSTFNPTPPSVTVPVSTAEAGAAEQCEVDSLSGPETYGYKVKSLLTGLPLTNTELAELRETPDALPTMIDGWLDTPQADTILQRFFMGAFQQAETDIDGITMMLKKNNTNWGRFDNPRENVVDLLRDNIRTSFARTALRIVKEGRPFNEVVTTDTFEMTTALLMFHAFLDQRRVNDQDQVQRRPMDEVTQFEVLRNLADEPPANEILNPNSPNFMRVYMPNFEDLCLPADQNQFTIQQNGVNGNDKVFFTFGLLVGRAERIFNRPANQGQPGNPCQAGNARRPPLLTRADFSDWRTVRLRSPADNETPTRFYRLSELRTATELASYADRVGFFTTMGFFTTWPTNEDNSSRVTLNQTLITALGRSFDGTTVSDFSPPDLDEEHSAPGTACYGCHQTLDPMRDFFRQSYSSAYGEQSDPDRMSLPAEFVFRGVRTTGNGVKDLANIIAQHPDFAPGWVQKMCYFANSAPCPEESEAFQDVVSGFTGSNLNFKTMLTDLLASPLVTYTDCVTDGTGQLRSISRREQFCSQLSHRLGIEDICGLNARTAAARSNLQRNMFSAVASIPKDTFGRGEPDPITISDTGMFVRATREVVCRVVAEQAYGPAFGPLSRSEALLKIVTDVMGLAESDPRHSEALEILTEHVSEGVATPGINERRALQSALLLACMSPSMAGVGF